MNSWTSAKLWISRLLLDCKDVLTLRCVDQRLELLSDHHTNPLDHCMFHVLVHSLKAHLIWCTSELPAVFFRSLHTQKKNLHEVVLLKKNMKQHLMTDDTTKQHPIPALQNSAAFIPPYLIDQQLPKPNNSAHQSPNRSSYRTKAPSFGSVPSPSPCPSDQRPPWRDVSQSWGRSLLVLVFEQ